MSNPHDVIKVESVKITFLDRNVDNNVTVLNVIHTKIKHVKYVLP